MGIQGLNNLLKRYAPQAFGELKLSSLKGQRVAIDAYNWVHTTYPSAKKEVVMDISRTDVSKHDVDEEEVFKEWIGTLFDFVKKWTNHSITPIFVFDGEYPMEKTETRLSRRESQQKTREQMLELKKHVRESDPLSITPDDIETLQKKIINTRTCTNDSIERLKQVLIKTGIPYVQAKYEGEQLCSMMALDGIVGAVYSTDTDNLAYGAPLLITKFAGYDWLPGKMIWRVKSVWYENILKQLEYNREKFVDLCILSGCDYNKRIPKLGEIRAFRLLNKYRNIDELPSNFDVSCLNHFRCREMFTKISHEKLFEEGYIDFDICKIPNLKCVLEKYECFEQHHFILTLIERTFRDKIPKEEYTHPAPPRLPLKKVCKNGILIIHQK